MRVLIAPDGAAAAEATAARIAARLEAAPASVLGLATGGTMEPVYAALIDRHRQGLSFAQATSFNLDEYVGLAGDHPQSYRRYMREHLFGEIDIDPARCFIPRGDIDPEKAAEGYEAELSRLGPIDLQLLGLGRNGHIGFNEPTSSLASRTRCVRLSASTLEANRRFFDGGETPPTTAVTMGVATIIEAREILLLAVGAEKAQAVQAMVEGPVTAICPASALQFHERATIVLDAAAAARLEYRERYEPAGGTAP
ncbi:glucosamine-6-phosphate deaminase [Pseudoroseicyclus aestuarii]|uniref:Glucosamine-6-phosphate deaminase n=1 Tax=Pseudoroseicyclus aestuarii TaxID=1795041 RepID=A0A318SW14_9RHOB|nr:glucosamine-6-phosphate deaminase [Pseudoroseicyclus aestuarii]PYE85682.1 glucosamine-6-phosphate deaminase [Pseudoroseicyclus aestuarii]